MEQLLHGNPNGGYVMQMSSLCLMGPTPRAPTSESLAAAQGWGFGRGEQPHCLCTLLFCDLFSPA